MRDDLPLDDAEDCAWMLVATGRAPHPQKWVPEIAREAQVRANIANLEAQF